MTCGALVSSISQGYIVLHDSTISSGSIAECWELLISKGARQLSFVQTIGIISQCVRHCEYTSSLTLVCSIWCIIRAVTCGRRYQTTDNYHTNLAKEVLERILRQHLEERTELTPYGLAK